MTLTRVNCCEDYRDTLTVDTCLPECVYFEHKIYGPHDITQISLDIQSVNVLMKVLSKWKEENNYD